MRKVSLEDAREICADGTYFPNPLRKITFTLDNFSLEGTFSSLGTFDKIHRYEIFTVLHK
jgi:hypothetical protein